MLCLPARATAKRHVRELATIIDHTGFAESDCNTRRYYAATKLVGRRPHTRIRDRHVYPCLDHRLQMRNMRIYHHRMGNAKSDRLHPVIAQLQAIGAYDIPEAHIRRLNNANVQAHRVSASPAKWALKTDDLRLFREIRGSKTSARPCTRRGAVIQSPRLWNRKYI